ncbi:hypothetical protein XJ44_03955 [Thermosipho affectus]|uniref:NERD domain-containing protein n=1 Tax=Thermosipho affectus TaxID=660294 RepID=A0ABX3IJX4_9BACT|nr:NERD domain-containing protein [Thermosipho affectus]ONN27472.1 hypothetical protein XJ44_03955 [Thermosipho affectus]
MLEKLKNEREKIKNEIEKLINRYDPKYVLSYIAFLYHFDSNDYSKVTYLLREKPILQFLSGVYLKNNNYLIKKPNLKKIYRLIQLTSKYLDLFVFSKYLETESIPTHHIELLKQINPEIYQFQLEDFIDNVFLKLDPFFINKFGFSINDAIDFGKKIIKKIEEKFNDKKEQNLQVTLEDICKIFTLKKDEFNFEGIKDINKLEKYFEFFSCEFGENKNYNSPLDENIIFRKPLIHLKDDEYLCLLPENLIFRFPEIFEYILNNEKTNQTKVWQQYKRIKSLYVEEKVYEFFSRIFPKKNMYRNLKYEKDYEVDLLILFDNKILIVESKSGILTKKALKGNEQRLKTDLKKLTEEAFRQGKRVIEYIKSSKSATFIRKSGKKLQIESSNYSSFYVINVTLETLMNLATNLKELQKFGLFSENEFPWSVYLFDLDIITRHVEYPSIFIHYLKERLKAQKENIFQSFDELSFFAWYLEKGNFQVETLKNYEKPDSIILHSWIDIFDDYYLNGGPPPRLKIENEILKIIKALENVGTFGFSDAISMLLKFDNSTRNKIIEYMNEKISKTKTDHKRHNFLIINKDLGVGFLFVSQYGKQELRERLYYYSNLLKYKYQVKKWIAFGKDVTDKKEYINEFVYLNYPWEYNYELEKTCENILHLSKQ